MLTKGNFYEFWQSLDTFGNFWQSWQCLEILCIFWYLFATSFVIFLQFLAILPIFGNFANLWQLSSTFCIFWLLVSTFGYFRQLLATIESIFWQFLAKYCNFWQLLSCHHATMSSSILWQCFARGSRRGIIEEVKREPMNPVPALFWITFGRKHKIQMIFGRKNQND